jgi:subtilisin family serine protease
MGRPSPDDPARHHLPRLTALGAALLLAFATLAGAASAGDATSPPPHAGREHIDLAADGLETQQVILVTGHELEVVSHPDGRRTVAFEDEVEHHTMETADGFYVIPADAAGLVPHQLDVELFNIDQLVAASEHVGDGSLPLIVAYDQAPGPSLQREGISVGRALPSIDAVATTVDGDTAQTLFDEIAGGHTADVGRTTSSGIDKVWLDGVVTASLDDSVPQVGAPAAWDAGYDGSGMTVAVLDTGIDAQHPDLVGQVVAAQNFTSDESDGDEHGHGTHVAATVAGTGAGSDGARPGVAPGADLVDAKVLNAAGSGLTSWVIAGMEWAALDQQVDVVNMSLGAGPSDGTDPLSVALDQLSADTGTVFVAAAGNLGPRDRTVATPAAADEAIAVGATWKSDFLYNGSSRGPRLGDHAIAPDLTAPGVSIVAARADGTSMGTPVDDLYTRATGTSMATPHVAGGVAILLQQHPDWGVAQIRAALVTTAQPHGSFTVYDQGGGRLDLEAAIDVPVLVTPAPLDLGYFPYPQEDVEPVGEEVTYTNLTDEPIELDLTLDVSDEDGNAPADGMLSVAPTSVTIPPFEDATVTVTVDVMAGEHGLYGGSLVATGEDGPMLRTPVGFHNEDERYELTVRGTDANGSPAAGNSRVAVMNVEDRDTYFESGIAFIDGVASARVPPGDYAVIGFIYTEDGEETVEVSAVADPEFTVTQDTEVVLDAQDANEITVDTPEHDTAPRLRTTLALFRQPADGPGFSMSSSYFADGTTFSALPTAGATSGVFEFFSRWQLADPDDPIDTPVLYDVVLPEDAVPEDLAYSVTPNDLATVVQRFHTHDPTHAAEEFRTAWRPWMSVATTIAQPVPMPGERIDLLSPADTAWTRTLLFAPPGLPALAGRMNAPRMQYQPGSQHERSWMEQPSAPSLIEGSPWHPSFPQYREGDVLELFIAEYGDAQRGHWGWSHGAIDDIAFRVFVDDDLLAEATRARGSFELPPEPSEVRLELDTAREGLDWWRYSTRTHTAWTFQTDRPEGEEPEMVPLLLIDHDLGVDLENRAPHPGDRRGPRTIEFEVRHQPDLDDPPAIADAELFTSIDDGATWQPASRLQQLEPGRFRATLSSRDTEGADVSLRVIANDVEGNAIEQDIIRAFGEPAR